jgi:hypothetical protein
MSLVGQISLVSISGLIGHNGGFISFISLSFISLVGFISLIGHIGLVGLICGVGHNDIVGVIGLSHVSLVGMVGLVGFILVSLIGFDDLSITSLFGSSASSVLHLITLFILAGLSIYRPLKQAAHRAHGVAIKQSSATKIANAASTYYLIASLFHVHSLMREKM